MADAEIVHLSEKRAARTGHEFPPVIRELVPPKPPQTVPRERFEAAKRMICDVTHAFGITEDQARAKYLVNRQSVLRAWTDETRAGVGDQATIAILKHQIAELGG